MSSDNAPLVTMDLDIEDAPMLMAEPQLGRQFGMASWSDLACGRKHVPKFKMLLAGALFGFVSLAGGVAYHYQMSSAPLATKAEVGTIIEKAEEQGGTNATNATSASQGGTLQKYDNELMKSIALDRAKIQKELLLRSEREKHSGIDNQIVEEKEDKARIQKELIALEESLQRVNASLVSKTHASNEYDKTIEKTEAAYMKILESSQTLLHVIKSETVNLTEEAA